MYIASLNCQLSHSLLRAGQGFSSTAEHVPNFDTVKLRINAKSVFRHTLHCVHNNPICRWNGVLIVPNISVLVVEGMDVYLAAHRWHFDAYRHHFRCWWRLYHGARDDLFAWHAILTCGWRVTVSKYFCYSQRDTVAVRSNTNGWFSVGRLIMSWRRHWCAIKHPRQFNIARWAIAMLAHAFGGGAPKTGIWFSNAAESL